MYKGQSITVIIPCLNEEQGIRSVLESMPEFVDEVIVVDNNSTDRTHDVAASLGAKVIHEFERGYGRSYKRGFANATGDVIVTLDGDHSYPVDAISYLLEAYLHLNVDFLNASRFPVRDSKAMSLKHKIGNLILSLTMSVLYFRWVRDSQSGMWVFRRSILAEHEARVGRDGVFRGDQDRGAEKLEGAVRGDLDHVHVAIGRDQAESLAGRISEPVVPGEETLLMNGPAVTVVIPVWNGREFLIRLLEKLRLQTYPIAEVIAVDNGSDDGAAEAAEQQGRACCGWGRIWGSAAR